MAANLPLIENDEFGDAFRAKVNAAIELANAIASEQDGVADLQDSLSNVKAALAAVRSDSKAFFASVRDALDLETDIRARAVAKVASLLGAAILGHSHKPGETPFLFTTSLEGLADQVAPLPLDGVITTALGRVYRTKGSQIIAARETVWNEPGRVSACRFGYQRVAAPSDPANDAVECGIACLDQNGRLLSRIVVKLDKNPVAMSGMQVVTCRVPSQVGDPVSITMPAGCVEWRQYMQFYGRDATSDAVTLSRVDVTNAGSYSPDLAATDGRVTALETAVAALNPASTGVPNGLATLDSTGTVVQLPLLKAEYLSGALQFVPGAFGVMENEIAQSTDAALIVDYKRNPYFREGSAWAKFAQKLFGLSNAQHTAIMAQIGSPAQVSGQPVPKIIYDLDLSTASVLRAANARFASIPNANMPNFQAAIGSTDASQDSYFVVNIERHAPVGGALYKLLFGYLTTAAPGPGLTQADAIANLTAIWDSAINYQPSA